MEIIAMLALAGVAAAIVLAPLFAPPAGGAPASGATGRDARHSDADALADLEFDHATGKLDDDDYAALRADLLHAGAAAQAHPPGASGTATRTAETLEAEILRARQTRRGCASCGAALPEAARFCPACGAPAVKR